MFLYSLKNNKFWKIPYSKKNKYQDIAFLISILVVVLILIFFNKHCSFSKLEDLYSKDLVSALSKGQVYFEKEPSQKLLELDNPYDNILRYKQGVARGKDYIWDAALYDGKYYAYFGVLPAILIMVPYHLITGKFLHSSIMTLFFTVLAATTMAILIKEIFKKYFPKIQFKYMIFSAIIMMTSTMLIWLNIAPRFYELVSAAGLFFAIFGVLLVLVSRKENKISYTKLTLGVLCCALAVACRPTQLLASVVIIPFIWEIFKKNLKENKNIIKLILCVAIPYMIVGGLLMYYNYIRFDNMFDFGTKYQLTMNDMINLKAKVSRIPTGIMCDLFNLPVFKSTFPFLIKSSNIIDTYSYYYVEDIPAGVFFLSPIAFFCFGIFGFLKNCKSKELKKFVISLLILGIMLVIVTSVQAGSTGRYFLDFSWAFVLAGILIFMNYVDNTKTAEGDKILSKVLNIILGITIIMSLLSGFCDIAGSYSVKNYSPKIYYNIEYSLMFMK